MDERLPILPPPPPARVALWALLNALWFRMVRGVGRRWRGTARIVQRTPPPASARRTFAWHGSVLPHLDRVGALAPEGRASARLGRRTVHGLWSASSRPHGVNDERATMVEGRRLRPSRAGEGT